MNEGQKWKFTGFEVHNVPYDGECGFTAVGHQLAFHKYRCEKEVSGDRVRRDTVAAIRLNFTCLNDYKLTEGTLISISLK